MPKRSKKVMIEDASVWFCPKCNQQNVQFGILDEGINVDCVKCKAKYLTTYDQEEEEQTNA